MKKYLNVLLIYLTFAQFCLNCDAGLLTDVLRRRQHHFFNNGYGEASPLVLNNPMNPYGPGLNNDWRSPADILKSREYLSSLYGQGNNNDIGYRGGALGIPFTNGDYHNDYNLPNDFTNNDSSNAINPGVINGNTPRPITNNLQNNEKIINDIKKINSIVDAIRQQNADYHSNTPGAGNVPIASGYGTDKHPSLDTGGITNTIPTVHINNIVGQGGNSNHNTINPIGTLHYNIPTTKRPNTIFGNSHQPTTKRPTHVFVTDRTENNPDSRPITSQPETNKLVKPNETVHREIKDPTKQNSKKHYRDDHFVLKPLSKRKFFVQVEPVIPDTKIVSHNETVYYIEK